MASMTTRTTFMLLGLKKTATKESKISSSMLLPLLKMNAQVAIFSAVKVVKIYVRSISCTFRREII